MKYQTRSGVAVTIGHPKGWLKLWAVIDLLGDTSEDSHFSSVTYKFLCVCFARSLAAALGTIEPSRFISIQLCGACIV